MADTGCSVLIRRGTPEDIPLLTEWSSTEPVAWVGARRFTDELSTGNYRPEWSWIAEQDGRMVGRALWWGPTEADAPVPLDCLTISPDVSSPTDVGAALIRAGLSAFPDRADLEFNVDVPTGWEADPAAVEAVTWRHAAAHRGGLSRTTERVSFARTAMDPKPPRSTRLRFAPASDAAFRALFAAVAAGSLDGHTIDMVTREGVEALADDDLAFYLSLPGERGA